MISDEDILKAKIFIVDDNILNVQILKKTLANAGYTDITTVTDPTTVLALYNEKHPDLILLDFNMPRLNGLQLMHVINRLDPDDYLPVLMLTGETDADVMAQALQYGAKDFLRKPYQAFELLLRSRNIIEVRLLYRQLKDRVK